MQGEKLAVHHCYLLFAIAYVIAGTDSTSTSGVAMGAMPSRYAANYLLLPAIAAVRSTPSVVSAPTAAATAAVTASVASTYETMSGPLVPAGMFLGKGLVPLPAKLVARITKLEFVEMYELLPESWLATDGTELLETQAAKQVSIFPKCWRTPVTDVLTWVQCFSALVGALSTKFADKVPEFMAYQALIVKCSRDYDGFGWVLYDRAFRWQVAVTKDLNWSKLNPTLHSLCLAGKAKNNKFCTICLSDNHTTDQCLESWQMFPPMYYPGQVRPLTPYPPQPPFAGMAPFGQGQTPPPPPNPAWPVPICKLFNRLEGPRCTLHPYC